MNETLYIAVWFLFWQTKKDPERSQPNSSKKTPENPQVFHLEEFSAGDPGRNSHANKAQGENTPNLEDGLPGIVSGQGSTSIYDHLEGVPPPDP